MGTRTYVSPPDRQNVLPHDHAAVGLLAYLVFSSLLSDADRDVVSLGAVLFGTQFPDLVDKPLAYYGILPYGRSLMHSLLVVPVVVGIAIAVARHADRRGLGIAFAVGMVTHPIADSYHALLDATLANAPYLLWPVLAIHEQPNPIAPWMRLLHIYAAPRELSIVVPDGVGVVVSALGGLLLLLSQMSWAASWSEG